MINGIGDFTDFNRTALVTVCALPSTNGDGTISGIVPMTFHVDHTEHDIDVAVTEQGITDIRGRWPVERRDDVDDVRNQQNHVPSDIGHAAEWPNRTVGCDFRFGNYPREGG